MTPDIGQDQLPVRHDSQHCINNNKRYQIHQQTDHNPFRIPQPTKLIAVIGTENSNSHFICDHIIRYCPQKNCRNRNQQPFLSEAAHCCNIFTLPQISGYKEREKYHNPGCG